MGWPCGRVLGAHVPPTSWGPPAGGQSAPLPGLSRGGILLGLSEATVLASVPSSHRTEGRLEGARGPGGCRRVHGQETAGWCQTVCVTFQSPPPTAVCLSLDTVLQAPLFVKPQDFTLLLCRV